MIYLKSGIAFRIKGNASSILNSCVALVLSHGNSDFHNCTLHMLPRQFKKCVKAAWNISHCLGKQSAVATAQLMEQQLCGSIVSKLITSGVRSVTRLL